MKRRRLDLAAQGGSHATAASAAVPAERGLAYGLSDLASLCTQRGWDLALSRTYGGFELACFDGPAPPRQSGGWLLPPAGRLVGWAAFTDIATIDAAAGRVRMMTLEREA